MAKWIVGHGIDEYIAKLGNLEMKAPETCKRAVFDGAAVVANAVRSNIQSLPVGDPRKGGYVTGPQKQGLLDGFGIAAFKNDGGFLNVKLGFDGYNSTVNKCFPNGQPNAMIARSLECGSSTYGKHPFIGPAVRSTKSAAEAMIKTRIDEQIEAIMK